MDQPALHRRDVTRSRFGDNARINLGDIHYHLSHPPARAEVVRVIPYPRNEDLVRRRDLIDTLDKLLPLTPGSRSAALWGLGGSGKTQIALDYVYRRCDADDECCVFWVHADSEATFLADYKTIGKKLGVDEQLDGTDLLDAVRNEIEARSKWLMILDNTDDLRIFGVGQQAKGGETKTSRDAHIAGTLVGARHGIEVRSMAVGLLKQGKTRWEVLKKSDADRHRRPEVSNSVLETWRISIERIRAESEISYRMLHVIAYVDSQDIPQELLAAAAGRYDEDDAGDVDDKDSTRQATELEVLEAIARLREFSFLSLRQTQDGGQSYEMHKIVQEAVRYGLRVRSPMETTVGKAPGVESGPEAGEAYYSGTALHIVDDLFPSSEPSSWAQCERYMTHTIRVGEWAEVSRTEAETSTLLQRVSYFLYKRGRWREKEPVDRRALDLRREVLGEEHPDTMWSMADLAVTYHQQGRYDKAESIYQEVLELRREVLGETHPDTISSMADLATIYHAQGQYEEAEELKDKALALRREVLGEKHPDTISSMADLAMIYHAQGRYEEDEEISVKVLELRREVLGDKHPDTISSMADLAMTYH
ncbi:hypothetical protein ACKAV7_001921 [Fusarium commune]